VSFREDKAIAIFSLKSIELAANVLGNPDSVR
jgi:hypothetical protein